uniref:NADH-ubiquinone oxidoreductase chain 6 n=1 Tax=Bostrichoidea sp. 5 KM-2017 TaxID=2219279 RepID=A0A346RGR0_9COLE|nr:NADH dehydrogenase subunit 6 [Bostrichoidea sp. 5 KM-2017]
MLNLTLISIILSISMIMMKHPLSITIILIIQSLLISLISGSLNYDFWFSYIMFMIMIGGMLVVFIYMTSIASNEKFNMFKMWLTLPIMLIIPNMGMMFFMNMEDTKLSKTWKFNEISLIKFYSWPSSLLMITLMIYLLMALIAIVKITQTNKGPLRQMN